METGTEGVLRAPLPHFFKVNELIATAGQPSEEQFTEIADAGYSLVLGLPEPEAKDPMSEVWQPTEAWTALVKAAHRAQQ